MKKSTAKQNVAQRPMPLNADERRQILGEQELQKTSKPFAESETESASEHGQSRGSRPYLQNIAESDRLMLQGVLKGNFVRFELAIHMRWSHVVCDVTKVYRSGLHQHCFQGDLHKI